MSSQMLAGEVSIADARLIQQLRTGDPAALDRLWEASKNDIWSVCSAMSDSRDMAIALLSDIYAGLAEDVRGWGAEWPVCCHLACFTWRRLYRLMELDELDGIDPTIPTTVALPSSEQVAAIVGSLPLGLRLVYLLDLFFGCPVDTLSELTDVPEQTLRDARAFAAWKIVSEEGAR